MSRPLSGESAFRALAHPTRRNIVHALRRGECPAGSLLPNDHLSKATVSRHLRALQQAGVVAFRRKGTSLVYQLNARALKPVEAFLKSLQPD
jgi:DNA-binding transcriptional ArsR family regulator